MSYEQKLSQNQSLIEPDLCSCYNEKNETIYFFRNKGAVQPKYVMYQKL